ncbi:hypothetical protein QDR37_02650 [Amnibacterium sp. CER49]|uniref:three-helix bundle dimerization domain-containing protein n=1 Tax=Amnibacterium sp. CER49 TaxID=3039161 RepID=UPI00244901F6|nr:hypothetical protein [Amnibacterium sp. CER49]MDH2442838.1 hypothetical protein [Amnibacterium sp. CER49]
MSTDFSADEVVREVTNTLAEKFPGLDRSTVEEIARDEVDKYVGRPVRDYIAVLAQRDAKRRLKQL